MSLSVNSVGSSSLDPSQGTGNTQALQLLAQIEQLIQALIATLQMTSNLNNNQSPSVGGAGGGGGGGGMPSFGGGGFGGGGAGAPPTLAAASPAAAPSASATPAPAASPSSAAAPTGTAPASTEAATSAPQPTATSAVQSPSASGGDMTPQQVAAKYNSEITSASQATGVPPGIIADQIWQESKGVADTPGGGLMQLGPDEFQKYGGGDISNPADNIRAGANYMKDLASQFGGNMGAALRAYNSGPNGVDPSNLNSTPAGTGDPTYVQKVTQAAQQSGLATA